MFERTDVLIDIFFNDLPMEKRVEAVAALGYKAIETWQGGTAAVVKKIGAACDGAGVRFVSVVLNFATDMAVAPVKNGNLKAFADRIDQYSDYALAAGCRSGIITTGNLVPGQSLEEHRKNLVECLRHVGPLAAKKGFALNVEPLNTVVDHKGYYLDCRQTALEIIDEVNLPNVKMLYDIYHMQIMHGNQLAFILPNLGAIGHFHTAGVPGRHELFSGETDYPFVLGKIVEAGYKGFFGLEYMPLLESSESLRKTKELLK